MQPGSVARDSLFGVVIARDGRTRTVESPIPGKLLGSIRALDRSDGGWDVVFAEMIPADTSPPPNPVARLWYGVYDGRRWNSVEQLPLPADTRVHSLHASQLVRHGDTLVWALTASTPGYNRDVALFERRGGHWVSEIVPTRGAGYPSVAYSDSLGLLLAVVRADPRWNNPDSARGGFDRSSLFLYGQDPTWRILRRIAHGVAEPVDHPSFVQSGEKLVLSWEVQADTRNEARAVVDVLHGPPDVVVVLDPSFAGHPPVRSIDLPGGNHLWITRHNPGGESPSQLRFLRASGPGVTLLGHLPSPFLGGFGAGAEPEFVDADRRILNLVFSLLVRARISCP
jgi:hypothetical protein